MKFEAFMEEFNEFSGDEYLDIDSYEGGEMLNLGDFSECFFTEESVEGLGSLSLNPGSLFRTRKRIICSLVSSIGLMMNLSQII